jgi:hypothetical protein
MNEICSSDEEYLYYSNEETNNIKNRIYINKIDDIKEINGFYYQIILDSKDYYKDDFNLLNKYLKENKNEIKEFIIRGNLFLLLLIILKKNNSLS